MTLKNIASRSEKSVIIEPETSKTIEEPNKLRLTLPDYKLSVGINIDDHSVFDDSDNIYREKLNNNIHTLLQSVTVQNKTNDKQNSKCSLNEDAKSNDSSKNICTVCRKSFISKKWFTKHMEKEHSGHKYACAYCPKCTLFIEKI